MKLTTPDAAREALRREVAEEVFLCTYGGTNDPDLTAMAEAIAWAQADAVMRAIDAAGWTPPAENASLRAVIAEARAALETYADPVDYTDSDGEPYPRDAKVHPGLLAVATLARIATLDAKQEAD